MIEIYKNIFLGNGRDCSSGDKEKWAIIHSCKHPCYHRSVGSKILPKNHKNYLVHEKENDLYLNMVDIDNLLKIHMKPMLVAALKFIEENIPSKKILIHCNQGKSRSPAIVLLFLAKRNKTINNESYSKAKEEFIKLYSFYQPGKGVDDYLNKYWDEIE